MKLRAFGIVVVGLVLVLAACAPPPSPFAVDVGSSQTTVLRGDDVTVSVSVVRGGVTGPVLLSVSGEPAGVTASFAGPVLPDGVSSTTVSLVVGPEAVEATTDLTVTAVAGARAASTQLSLTVESLTVTGLIVDALGLPRPGVDVLIQGTTDTSAADGTFEIAGVAVPYDAATFVGGANPIAHVFVGLRAADPTLFPFGAFEPLSLQTTTVAGALPAAVPAGHVARVCVEGLTVPLYGCDRLNVGEVAYEVELDYAGGPVAARVHALLVEVDVDGRPVAYPSYGTVDAALIEGGTTSGVDITSVSGPLEGTITLSANVPAGFVAASVAIGARLNERFTMALPEVSPLGGALGSFVVPILPGATYGVKLDAYTAGTGTAAAIAWRFGLPAGASVTLDLDGPPVAQSPADGATGVGVGDVLAVAGAPVGVRTFVVGPAAVNGPTLAITTVESQATIPDLTELGFALLAATEHSWYVVFIHGEATPEASGEAWYRAYADATLALNSGGPSPAAGTVGTAAAPDARSFFTP